MKEYPKHSINCELIHKEDMTDEEAERFALLKAIEELGHIQVHVKRWRGGDVFGMDLVSSYRLRDLISGIMQRK